MMLFAQESRHITAFLFVWITQYYTESRFRPVLSIAESAKTGAATVIITGFAVAMECTAAPVIVISGAILGSYFLGVNANLHGISSMASGFYGTAIATMGMLSTCAYILAMDTFGPITDNAGGIIEMSQQPEEVRRRTDRLDAVGNTTKALTKGYAIGSAALAAFLLFTAYTDAVKEILAKRGQQVLNFAIDIGNVPVFVGVLLARCWSSCSARLQLRLSAGRHKRLSKKFAASSRPIRESWKALPIRITAPAWIS